ncbi:MAG: DUF3800 domain-containing protein [Candidatus Sulfotelmatobacter sp.]
MIFRAFFDESGTSPHENKSLVIGGFVGHIDEWKQASEAWDACLRESPSINYFSRNEANMLDGQFRHWKRSAADEKVKNLAGVIAQFRLQGFCASVPHSWFANRDAQSSKGMIGSRVYDWGFLTAISGVLQYMSKLKVDYTVDFIFDERSELSACIGIYNEMKNSGAVEVMAHAGICLPGNDEEVAALQMADLLAGEFSHLSENEPPSLEPFSIIAKAKPVIHVPCTPPPLIPDILEIQKLGADVKRSANCLLKRIYGDKEKSLEVLKDTVGLQKQKAFFDLEFQRLCELSKWRRKVDDSDVYSDV